MNIAPSVLGVLSVLLLNSVLFAFYLGKLSSRVENNVVKLSNHEGRLIKLEDNVQEEVGLRYRLETIEKLIQGSATTMQDLRSEVVASRSIGETERAALKRHGEKMEREIGGIHRQLANIAAGRTGLIEIVRPEG